MWDHVFFHVFVVTSQDLGKSVLSNFDLCIFFCDMGGGEKTHHLDSIPRYGIEDCEFDQTPWENTWMSQEVRINGLWPTYKLGTWGL